MALMIGVMFVLEAAWILFFCVCEVVAPRRPLKKRAVMFEAGLEIGFMREPRGQGDIDRGSRFSRKWLSSESPFKPVSKEPVKP